MPRHLAPLHGVAPLANPDLSLWATELSPTGLVLVHGLKQEAWRNEEGHAVTSAPLRCAEVQPGVLLSELLLALGGGAMPILAVDHLWKRAIACVLEIGAWLDQPLPELCDLWVDERGQVNALVFGAAEDLALVMREAGPRLYQRQQQCLLHLQELLLGELGPSAWEASAGPTADRVRGRLETLMREANDQERWLSRYNFWSSFEPPDDQAGKAALAALVQDACSARLTEIHDALEEGLLHAEHVRRERVAALAREAAALVAERERQHLAKTRQLEAPPPLSIAQTMRRPDDEEDTKS
jgi:hypothetical protein